MRTWLCAFLAVLVFHDAVAAAPPPVTVGIEGRLSLRVAESALQARPLQREAAVAVRIAGAEKEASTTVYDLRYIGLTPGRHDLRPYLLKADGSPMRDLPPLEVEIRALLPADYQGALASGPISRLSFFGGYRWLLTGAFLLWAAAGLYLLRRRRPEVPTESPFTRVAPRSLLERLEPLVQEAAAGRLSVAQKAELERLVLGHWRERLGWQELPAAEAIMRLRAHAEAGRLLRALEDWLHRRPGSGAVDLQPLLATYAPAETELART